MGLLVLIIEIRKETLAKVHRVWLVSGGSFHWTCWIMDTCLFLDTCLNSDVPSGNFHWTQALHKCLSLLFNSSSSSSSLFLSDHFYFLLSFFFFVFFGCSLFLLLFLTPIDCTFLFAGYYIKCTLTCLSCYSILLLFWIGWIYIYIYSFTNH